MNNERNTSDILKELLKQNQNFTAIIKLCHKIDFDEKLDEVDADIINYILNQLEYIHGNNKLINILHIKKYLQAI